MTRARRWFAAAAVLAVAGATGCGSASPPAPPRGVDGLVVPTPEPAAEDFVAGVDNPWLPLPAGASWTYAGAAGTSLVVTATEGPEHEGIRTTAREQVVRDARGREVGRVVDHLAQDEAGNVWWLGRDGRWFDEAGLAMPADPRFGDGFRMAAAPGLDVRARVVAVDDAVTVPLGTYHPVVVLEVTTDGVTGRERYARGVGLVSTEEAGLVAHDEPR
ncbi:hypothetical protein [Nocardioides sp. SYSU DS0651]|uniref:hypothetical protein n=1 Tax=Nocardioides sp. SYSU DS0651 TaxID=3415955 RepID=UPI003F4C7F6A